MPLLLRLLAIAGGRLVRFPLAPQGWEADPMLRYSQE